MHMQCQSKQCLTGMKSDCGMICAVDFTVHDRWEMWSFHSFPFPTSQSWQVGNVKLHSLPFLQSSHDRWEMWSFHSFPFPTSQSRSRSRSHEISVTIPIPVGFPWDPWEFSIHAHLYCRDDCDILYKMLWTNNYCVSCWRATPQAHHISVFNCSFLSSRATFCM